jgi:hypothetical protein
MNWSSLGNVKAKKNEEIKLSESFKMGQPKKNIQ